MEPIVERWAIHYQKTSYPQVLIESGLMKVVQDFRQFLQKDLATQLWWPHVTPINMLFHCLFNPNQDSFEAVSTTINDKVTDLVIFISRKAW